MTPQDALVELLARVGTLGGYPVLVSAEELSQWPAAAVAALKAQKLLMSARQAVSIVCPGCEQQCVMPVNKVPAGPRGAAAFVVCNKRSDINRVPIPSASMAQWRCDADAVAGFVATSLGLRRSAENPATAGLLNIGMTTGDERRQMLGLRADGELALVAGSNAIPLAELICYRDGAYSLDGALIRRLVDFASTADPRYTPSNARREARKLDTQAMYESWRKAYRELKKQRRNMSDVWYSRQIEKMDTANSRSADTIRKHMKT